MTHTKRFTEEDVNAILQNFAEIVWLSLKDTNQPWGQDGTEDSLAEMKRYAIENTVIPSVKRQTWEERCATCGGYRDATVHNVPTYKRVPGGYGHPFSADPSLTSPNALPTVGSIAMSDWYKSCIVSG